MAKPDITPARLTPSARSFYVPPTVQSDFSNLLNTDIPNFTETFRLIHNWNNYQAEDEETFDWLRATYYPIDWKSKMGNSDMSQNIKTDFQVEIHKGDILLREDGQPLMLNWNVQRHINNQATQAVECNHYLTLYRYRPAETDDRGYMIQEAGEDTIIDRMPVCITDYAGRPDYASAIGIPGIQADMLTTGQIQVNELTKTIRINDEYDYGGFRYRIINISWPEVSIDGTYGIINFNAKRVAGKYEA